MKFKKVKSSDISTGAAQIVGAGTGFMATNGIANAIAKVDDEALITEEQKKTKLMVAGAAILVGGALTLMVDGNDVLAVATRSFGTGLAGGGVKGVVQHLAKDSVATIPAGTPSARLISGALGCPCDTPEPTYPTYKALAMPSYSVNPAILQPQETSKPTYGIS